jgi:hypothetical protein
MADDKIIMPDDAANTGKKVRTQTRTVGANTVHEHYVILQDETSDNQASISAAGALKVDGSAVTQPVSGTVTVTVPATGGGTEAAAQRVTIANDSTGVLSIDDNGASVTVDAAAGGIIIGDGTNPIVMLTDGADNVVNTNNQLITASMGYVFDGATWDRAKGDSTDGTLVNLGANNDVTVAGVATEVTSAAILVDTGQIQTAVEKIDDVVHVDDAAFTLGTHSGVMMMGFAGTQSVNANDAGAIAMEVDGAVHIHDGGNTITVDGAVTTSGTVTEASASAILTSVQLIDDAIFVDDTATHATGTTKLMGVGAVADPTDAAVNTNDIGMLAMNTNRALKTILQANSGVDIGDVDVTSAVISSGTITTVSSLGVSTTGPQKLEDVAHATGDAGIACFGTANEANTVRAADNDYIPIALDTEGNVRTVGNRDHDAIDAGEPVKIGAKAVVLLADPTAVASNDRTDLYAMRNGIQFTLGGHPNPIHRQFNITDADGAQTDLNILNAVVAATDVCVVTALTVACANSNTVDVQCRIGFGAANTPGNDALKVILSHPGIAKGSGLVLGNGGGIVGMGAAGDELRMTCGDPVTGSIDVCVTYFIVSNA